MQLRSYQQAAVNAVYTHLRERTDNPAIVLPTGSGKSHVLGTIAADTVQQWEGRALVLAHVQELLEQNAEKIRHYMHGVGVGIYSAGLRRRDTGLPIIVAGIQSVYRRACELGAFDLIIIDEAHLIPADGEGMYRQFLADMKLINPHMRVVGLTATPYRLKSGHICTPKSILNAICYEAGVKELIQDGYLCPLVSKAGKDKPNTASLHKRAGEFMASETEAMMDQEELVVSACSEIVEHMADRHACLIFAAGVEHAQHIESVLREQHSCNVASLFGETPSAERDALITQFKNGSLTYLVNVGVLTTGFDAPHVDCVVLLRPTMSTGLFVQMCGRGFRLHPNKKDCLVLDYGDNVMRHGPVDAVHIAENERTGQTGEAPAKECPECQTLIATGFATCPECGFVFPPPETKQHKAHASTAGILTGQFSDTEYTVEEMSYSVHTKMGADDSTPKTLRVEYQIGWNHYHSEWVCVEHTGFARNKAEAWWRERTDLPIPSSAAEAVALAHEGLLAEPTQITVRDTAGEKFPRIIAYGLSEKPTVQSEPALAWYDDDEVPF